MMMNSAKKTGKEDLYQSLYNDDKGFRELSQYIKKTIGLEYALSDKNRSLFAGRLVVYLRKYSLQNYSEYLRLLKEGDPEIQKEFVSDITTHTTQFFREIEHFQLLNRLLPEILEKKEKEHQHELRVWCAACSTGQEPYSIAMAMLETLGNLMFSDIDLASLETASEGQYNKNDLTHVPPELAAKYFRRSSKVDGEVAVIPELQKMIRFAPVNLSDPLPFEHRFDLVFCRNVLIYFEPKEACKIVERIAEKINIGGYLFLGHSEGYAGKCRTLRSLGSAVFVRVP